MALSGDLATMDLADLLEWVARRVKSGVLRLRHANTEKRLGFRDGRLNASSSNDPRETLGQTLVRDRLVSEEDLFRALSRQEQEARRLGEILVDSGQLTDAQLRRVLERNSEEIVYDVFLWSAGTFAFDDAMRAEHWIPLDMDLTLVVAEGLHRRERWTELRQLLPSSEVRFTVRARPPDLDPAEHEMLALAEAGRTLASISLETRRSRYETTLRLHSLVARGVLEPNASSVDEPDSDVVGTIAAMLASAADLRAAKRFTAAMALYQEVLTLDRINQRAKKGLQAAADEQRTFQLAARVPRDKVPVLRLGAMALSREHFDPHEGFVLSRINGEWSVDALLKLCPIPEDDTLAIFARLVERGVVELA